MTLQPGFAQVTCLTVTCTGCGVPLGEDTDGVALLFESEQAATAAIEDCGWWLLATGPVCGRCAAEQACAELGHAWNAWRPCACDGRIRTHVVAMAVRRCEQCGHTDTAPLP